jgi:hypothetical protein
MKSPSLFRGLSGPGGSNAIRKTPSRSFPVTDSPADAAAAHASTEMHAAARKRAVEADRIAFAFRRMNLVRTERDQDEEILRAARRPGRSLD